MLWHEECHKRFYITFCHFFKKILRYAIIWPTCRRTGKNCVEPDERHQQKLASRAVCVCVFVAQRCIEIAVGNSALELDRGRNFEQRHTKWYDDNRLRSCPITVHEWALVRQRNTNIYSAAVRLGWQLDRTVVKRIVVRRTVCVTDSELTRTATGRLAADCLSVERAECLTQRPYRRTHTFFALGAGVGRFLSAAARNQSVCAVLHTDAGTILLNARRVPCCLFC